ncbi:hypothetical protein ACFQZC_38235 [Streptacidiphilus monticola]
MSATRLDEDSAWQLADLLSRSRTAPVAVVIPTSTHESHFPEAHRLDCDLTTPQPAPVAGQEVLLQRITQTEYEMLHADLHLSERDALPAEDEWHHVPQTTAPLDDKPPHTPRPDHTEVDTAEADPAEADSGPEGDGDRSPRPVLLSVFSAFQTAANPATVTLPNPEPAPTTQGLDSASRDEDGTPASQHAQPPAGEPEGTTTTQAEQEGHDGVAPTLTSIDAPQLQLLGPLQIQGGAGLGSSARGRRMAELAAYLLLHPHHSRDTAAQAMSPEAPWTYGTISSRLSELRQELGTAADGQARVGRTTMTGLLPVLHDVRCDWHTFQRLAKRGLAADAHGVTDLEEALALVRGRPFEGTLASWAAPVQQEMISRIIDVAHTVAHHRTRGGFYDHARKAVTLGLAIEPAAELLIRDWIVLEMNAGNRAALPRSAPTSPPHYATSTPTWNPQPSNSSPTHRPKPPGTPPRPSHTKLRSTARRTADHDTCQNTPAAAQLSELPRVSWSPVVWVQADCGVASWR